MSHWNHRAVKHTTIYINSITKQRKSETHYTIEECYFDAGETENPRNMTEGLKVVGESIWSLEWTLREMLKCLDYPSISGNITEVEVGPKVFELISED